MSHIVEARTKIQNPDVALLQQALEIVAGAHEGGHVEQHILDFGGRQQRISTGLAVAVLSYMGKFLSREEEALGQGEVPANVAVAS